MYRLLKVVPDISTIIMLLLSLPLLLTINPQLFILYMWAIWWDIKPVSENEHYFTSSTLT